MTPHEQAVNEAKEIRDVFIAEATLGSSISAIFYRLDKFPLEKIIPILKAHLVRIEELEKAFPKTVRCNQKCECCKVLDRTFYSKGA